MKALLKKHFPTLYDERLLDEIAQVGKIVHLKQGDYLMDTGTSIKFIPLVLSGVVKVFREDDDHRELLLYYLEGGQSCAHAFICCMVDEISNIRAVVEEEAEVIKIPIQYMDEWMDKYRVWKEFVMRSYTARFDELFKTIDLLAFHKLDERLLTYLKEKSRILGQHIFYVTHQEIANEMGTSREVISRLLKKLEQNGQIEMTRNKIKLLGEVAS